MTVAELHAYLDSKSPRPAIGRTTGRARSRQHEHSEQVRVIAWARENLERFPALALLYAIPNGGHRSKAVAAKMKAEGSKRGMPDMALAFAAGGHHGLFVELKQTKLKPKRGGKGGVSDAQSEVIEQLRAGGYAAHVAYGADHAIELITNYLEQP